jgi:hypothetical protein
MIRFSRWAAAAKFAAVSVAAAMSVSGCTSSTTTGHEPDKSTAMVPSAPSGGAGSRSGRGSPSTGQQSISPASTDMCEALGPSGATYLLTTPATTPIDRKSSNLSTCIYAGKDFRAPDDTNPIQMDAAAAIQPASKFSNSALKFLAAVADTYSPCDTAANNPMKDGGYITTCTGRGQHVITATLLRGVVLSVQVDAPLNDNAATQRVVDIEPQIYNYLITH